MVPTSGYKSKSAVGGYVCNLKGMSLAFVLMLAEGTGGLICLDSGVTYSTTGSCTEIDARVKMIQIKTGFGTFLSRSLFTNRLLKRPEDTSC